MKLKTAMVAAGLAVLGAWIVQAPAFAQLEPEPGTVADFEANVPNTIYFGFNRADLTSEAQQILDQQAEWLRTYPQATIEVQGYADAVGNPEYNLELSQRRADAARGYLIENGVSIGQVTAVVSFGEDDLAIDTPNREPLNRRVVTLVTSDAMVAIGEVAVCPAPEESALVQTDSLGTLRDELRMRISDASTVENAVRADWNLGGRPLFTEAELALVECSVALGYARDGTLHERHVAACDCHYNTMVALQQ